MQAELVYPIGSFVFYNTKAASVLDNHEVSRETGIGRYILRILENFADIYVTNEEISVYAPLPDHYENAYDIPLYKMINVYDREGSGLVVNRHFYDPIPRSNIDFFTVIFGTPGTLCFEAVQVLVSNVMTSPINEQGKRSSRGFDYDDGPCKRAR